MRGEKFHAIVRREVDSLYGIGLLNAKQRQTLAARYSAGAFDISTLMRWFAVLGAVSVGAGIVLLLKESMDGYRAIELATFVGAAILFGLGQWLTWRGLKSSAQAVELIGAFCLMGLTFTLGIHYSTGSGNWPALVGIDTVLFLILAYALVNRLLLIFATLCAFTWFGGASGYESGWGMYWLGMSYPVRFLFAGAASLGLAAVHNSAEGNAFKRWAGFSRVYSHYGLIVLNLSLWMLSLFGFYEDYNVDWSSKNGERLAFTLLWGMSSAGCLYAGSIRPAWSVLRPYGLVFLLINGYTAYFQFIAYHSPALFWIHLLVIGGSLCAIGASIETRRRQGSATRSS